MIEYFDPLKGIVRKPFVEWKLRHMGAPSYENARYSATSLLMLLQVVLISPAPFSQLRKCRALLGPKVIL